MVKHMPNRDEGLDQVFRALADGSRRDMVERLIRGPATVGELAKPLAMSLPAVMQHLQVLRDCGLVRSEKVGRTRTCYVVTDGLRTAEDWLHGQRTNWESRLDSLGGFLDEQGERS
jgi:DNA-binding transcriptional ArsR family regulator